MDRQTWTSFMLSAFMFYVAHLVVVKSMVMSQFFIAKTSCWESGKDWWCVFKELLCCMNDRHFGSTHTELLLFCLFTCLEINGRVYKKQMMTWMDTSICILWFLFPAATSLFVWSYCYCTLATETEHPCGLALVLYVISLFLVFIFCFKLNHVFIVQWQPIQFTFPHIFTKIFLLWFSWRLFFTLTF